MARNSLVIILGTLIILLGLMSVFLEQCSDDWCFVFNWQKVRAVDSFDRCAQLGFPVMESYPRQCVAGGKTYAEKVAPTDTVHSDMVRVSAPISGAVVRSPLTVSGEARGTWYFEASFPVKLLDGNGKVLAAIPAQAKSDWMTTDFVPFTGTLTFENPKTPTGTLVFQKDNPSGLPQHDASMNIPVRFNTTISTAGSGVLEGVMTIGPICPVERPDHPCVPTTEMYAARKIFVYGRDKQTLMAELTPDAEGKFSATLFPGTYFIDMAHQPIGGISGVPTTVTIATGKTVTLNIDVDTGIR